MFCNRCGKFIDYDSVICNECAQQYYKENITHSANTYYNANNEYGGYRYDNAEKVQTFNAEQVNVAPSQPRANTRMLGFRKALISAIFPFVAFLITYIAFAICIVGYVGSFNTGIIAFYAVFSLGSLAMDIVAMVFSTQSIHLVTKTVKNGGARPIATQVCGIVGRVSSIFVAVMINVFFIAFMSIVV